MKWNNTSVLCLAFIIIIIIATTAASMVVVLRPPTRRQWNINGHCLAIKRSPFCRSRRTRTGTQWVKRTHQSMLHSSPSNQPRRVDGWREINFRPRHYNTVLVAEEEVEEEAPPNPVSLEICHVLRSRFLSSSSSTEHDGFFAFLSVLMAVVLGVLANESGHSLNENWRKQTTAEVKRKIACDHFQSHWLIKEFRALIIGFLLFCYTRGITEEDTGHLWVSWFSSHTHSDVN